MSSKYKITTIRMPPEFYEQVRKEADADHRSVSTYILVALEEKMKRNIRSLRSRDEKTEDSP